MAEKLNIAVLASGKGSNLRAILNAIQDGSLCNAAIAVVISNNSDAGALEIAREYRIPAVHLSRKQFSADESFNNELLKTLENYNVNFIALAGYMKKVDAAIILRFRNRIVNIHPALLPAFGGNGMYGMHVHEAVISQKAAISGATVHIVDEEYDRGPIVLQKIVAVAPDETPETLAEKVLKLEHELYPEAIRLFAEGNIKLNSQPVEIVK
ncbi:MAG TPA: phosphoribosylglycinamide formyltransferase [Bacteroidota bacterium]|nr:phosphoribosylglycinamide formyltransferase [Bacteroidota bacterium]